jgi:hypothetical protein
MPIHALPQAPIAIAGVVAATTTATATIASPAQGPPVYTALAMIYTVKDAWREGAEGLAGQPAIRELEERWGGRWQPGNTIRVQFCRRRVIWDEVIARVARGKGEGGGRRRARAAARRQGPKPARRQA